MGLLDKVTKKLIKTASTEVTDSVKKEVKTVAINAFPIVVGIGLAIAGFALFKSSTPKAVRVPRLPSFSTTSTVTHNWFLDEATRADVVAKIIKQQSL